MNRITSTAAELHRVCVIDTYEEETPAFTPFPAAAPFTLLLFPDLEIVCEVFPTFPHLTHPCRPQ